MPDLRVAVFVVWLGVPACASTEDPDPAPGVGPVSSHTPKCSAQVCGTHSQAMLECVPFWKLSSSGTPNDNGIRIVNVRRSDNTPMQLVADGDRLVGVDPDSHEVLAEHLALTGTVITTLWHGLPRLIRIDHVALDDEQLWASSRDSVEAYDLTYDAFSTGGSSQQIRTIVFRGDAYDPLDKRVRQATATDDWMHFACIDSVLYRMHMIGYTSAASARLGIVTPIAHRQTMLNAFTGNACGNGVTFSSPSEPITLTEIQGLLPSASPYQAPSASTEAIWSPRGMECLDVHRMATNAGLNALYQAAIWAECERNVPSCAAMLPDWTAHGVVLTGNPSGAVLIAP